MPNPSGAAINPSDLSQGHYNAPDQAAVDYWGLPAAQFLAAVHQQANEGRIDPSLGAFFDRHLQEARASGQNLDNTIEGYWHGLELSKMGILDPETALDYGLAPFLNGKDAGGFELTTSQAGNFANLINGLNLDGDQKQFFMQQMLAGEPHQALLTTANEWSEANLARQRDAENDARLKTALAQANTDLTNITNTYRPGYVGEVNRYTGAGEDMSAGLKDDFIWKDHEYSDAIGQAEAGIRNQIKQVRQNAALNNANAGVRQSGKNTNQALNAEMAASGQYGQIRGSFWDAANKGLDASKNALQDFDQNQTNAKSSLNLGVVPDFTALSTARQSTPVTDLYAPRATAIDEFFGTEGLKSSWATTYLNALLGAAGIAQNGVQQVSNALPFGKN